jgi:hypothetical protein
MRALNQGESITVMKFINLTIRLCKNPIGVERIPVTRITMKTIEIIC